MFFRRKPTETKIAKVIGMCEMIDGATGDFREDLEDGDIFVLWFVTFELENGEHKEFRLSDFQLGLIKEGDVGQLTFKGRKFIGFLVNN